MGRLQGLPKLRGRMDEHAAFFHPALVWGIERGRERSEGSDEEDLDGSETKPLMSESGLECRLSERGRCRARDHGVDSESEAALPMGPLIGLPRRYRDDIVDRGDSKTMCHPCDPWKIPFDDGRPRCESVVEFGEGLFLQDPGRPPRAVHVESTKSNQVARALERRGVHRAHMAIDSSRDDRVVR